MGYCCRFVFLFFVLIAVKLRCSPESVPHVRASDASQSPPGCRGLPAEPRSKWVAGRAQFPLPRRALRRRGSPSVGPNPLLQRRPPPTPMGVPIPLRRRVGGVFGAFGQEAAHGGNGVRQTHSVRRAGTVGGGGRPAPGGQRGRVADESSFACCKCLSLSSVFRLAGVSFQHLQLKCGPPPRLK